MIRKFAGVLLPLLACIPIAQEGNLRIVAGKRIELSIPDAMIAISRAPSRARVLVSHGKVILTARQPGRTQISVLTPTRLLRFEAVVTPDPLPDHDRIQNPPPDLPNDASDDATDKSQADDQGGLPPAPRLAAPPSIASIGGQPVPLEDVRVQPMTESGVALAEVQTGRSTRIHVLGATAALSVDSELVDVSAKEGEVDVSGRAPGRAEVLIVTPEGVRSLYVLVSPAPPVYPPGFIPPLVAEDQYGSYELDFVSNPRQVQNRYDFTMTKEQHTIQMHLVNVDFFNGLNGFTNSGNVDVPSGFLRFKTPQMRFTLLDEEVRNSPLTVNDAIVRGVHLAMHSFTLHAGYSPLASIYNFLIPTQREAVFGLSHEFKLSTNSELIQNAYYFPTHTQTYTAGHPGTVATLEYFLHRPEGLEVLAEAGFSHGLGAAGEFQWSNQRNFVEGSYRRKPKDFGSLSLGNLPGVMAEVSWNRTITPRVVSYVNVSRDHILLPTGEQTNDSSTANLQFKLSRHWSVSPGAVYSDFSQSSGGSEYSVHSLSLPQEINFDRKFFGAGFQYQLAKTSGSFSPGQDFRGSVRIGGNRIQLTAFAERQTQALTVSSLYSQIPALQIELQRLGLTAINPAQLAALLQDNAFLVSLGLSQQATVNLVPVRVQTGASFSFNSRGARPQHLSLDFIENKQQQLQGDGSNWVQSGNYTLPLTTSNELSVSYSWFHYSALGRSQYSPEVTVGLKHNFSSLPSFFSPGAHGTITGVVYVDQAMGGVYTTQAQTLANVDVILDGLTHTQTNERGRYSFTHLGQGEHTVEVAFKASQPFWFTTPSVVTTAINKTADFGITYAASELVGHVKNDAGLGVADVEIQVTGPTGMTTAHTDADGRFSVSGLHSGEYELVVDPNTVPPGHALEELRPLERWLENGIPKSADFLIRAIRTVLGQVSYYDPESGEYSPILGATVKIPELSLEATTDRQGKFIMRELPSGSYTLVVSDGVFNQSRPISIPPSPIELQEAFRIQKRKRE